MNRNGIEEEELSTAFEAIARQGLQLEAVFTHHSSADEANDFYELQKKNFERVKEKATVLAKRYGFEPLRFHSCNSAALFRSDGLKDAMARVGIAAYGCLELTGNLNAAKLKPVLSVHAKRLSKRSVRAGECVGYSAAYKAPKECIISNYDFGYGDGFLRACSNRYRTPQGIAIAGRISMDNSSFISDKEVLLIFDDARVAAKFAGTISYEMLTALKPNLKRSVLGAESYDGTGTDNTVNT
jgi:alanine racemase